MGRDDGRGLFSRKSRVLVGSQKMAVEVSAEEQQGAK